MAEWAVFTGDIVKSSDMTSDELALIFKGLDTAAQDIGVWQGTAAPLTRYRGDGWQMAVTPGLCFRAMIAVRAAVRRAGKGFETRIGIGLGAGDITGTDLSGADGAAFVRSGHALDGMKRGVFLSAPDAPLTLRAVLPLADHIIKGWTSRQAEVAYLMLPPIGPTQADVAEALGLTQQTVQQQIDSSGVARVLEVCDVMEELE
tara:strand:+ start:248 stop:856 length:609 start_codon:yes stop_codon:yes gene_type:complete